MKLTIVPTPTFKISTIEADVHRGPIFDDHLLHPCLYHCHLHLKTWKERLYLLFTPTINAICKCNHLLISSSLTYIVQSLLHLQLLVCDYIQIQVSLFIQGKYFFVFCFFLIPWKLQRNLIKSNALE